MTKIFVTKPYLPPKDEYFDFLSTVFETGVLTNYGPLVHKLEEQLSEFLKVENFQYVTNGTIALQLALKALGIEEGEIITTPFSYVATTSSILWERCSPVFVDIEPNNFTIDVTKIEEAITPRTKAIMPVHVFGYACNVDEIQKIADKHNLKVIYDAAHAFGSFYNGKSLVDYGDISTLSFHATKLFHTIEGGACVVKDNEVNDLLAIIKAFGHSNDDHFALGINGKQSEMHAAMGLANLKHIYQIVNERKRLSGIYDTMLASLLQRPAEQNGLQYNYAYYPVIFENEQQLLETFARLAKIEVYPRRYFYPSLNKLPYLKQTQSCPVSEDITTRIACLPLFVGLKDDDVEKIGRIIGENK